MRAFQLSKTDHRSLASAVRRLEEPAAALIAALQTYNDALSDINDVVTNIEAKWQAVWDNRSERWRCSEAGQDVAETLAEWSELAVESEAREMTLLNLEMLPGTTVRL